ncbi:putative methionine--tRNA ligase, cytoplasmic protein rar1 [Gaertneriomyces sp. JEL0708]|nr:putative methionine--tRNA ligase, cytoplasmic protein rar1 [Gaertneriomyces sp. JEL0708]
MSADGPVTSGPTPKVRSDITIELDHHKRIVLPKAGERNILITSALPYVNNVPHLGNIIGCVLSADVYARFCRLRGYNTLFICGTDEYGTATETKALEEGVTCQQLCDKYHAIHKSTYEWFKCDFDHFGRTPTEKHKTITQGIYLDVERNGLTFPKTMTQLYCEKHNAFLADRFVEGTCPSCGYADARGDQCDQCGKLLDPTELRNPHCKLDKATPVLRDTTHLFLDLAKQQPDLEKWVEKSSVKGAWSQNTINITNAWLKEGLRERCITRDLKWGVPVPKKEFEDKVFYVWFEACIGYPSITANYTEDWQKWWKNPENVQLYQFMGKDNVPFHTVIFPSTLLGTGEEWTLLHHISTTEYLQYENGKFSKSRGVGVFGNHVVEVGVSSSVWRYYLLSNRPETGDSQFTWAGFVAANNNELLANLGNFVNRVVKFLNAKYDGIVPAYGIQGEAEQKLIEDVNALLKSYVEALEAVKIRAALKLAMDISARGNLYLQENKIDNKLFADHRERCDTVVAMSLNLSYLLGALVYPFMPDTSETIWKMLKVPARKIGDAWEGTDLEEGHQVGKAEYLFTNIKPEMVEIWRKKYGGNQKDSDSAATETMSKTAKRKMMKGKAKAPEPLIPEGVTATPEMLELEAKIKAQGEVVRLAKAEKKDAAEVTKEVETLMALKTQLKALVAETQKSN